MRRIEVRLPIFDQVLLLSLPLELLIVVGFDLKFLAAEVRKMSDDSLGALAATRNLDCHLGGTLDRGSCPSFLLIKFIAASYNLDRI